jgi:putative thioredoxin
MGSSIAVNQDNFTTDVIQKSHEKPVLVDFFATWCGPCQMLKPMLEKLVREYDFVLAKVDIDQNPDLAHTYGVEGVPDVRIVIDGEVNPGFVGVLPEPQLRELLAQLNLRSDLDQTLENIYNEASRGNLDGARTQLEGLLQDYPENRGLLLEAANFYIELDEPETAGKLLALIREDEKPFFAKARGLKALVDFKQIASEPDNGNELDGIYKQAATAVLAENYGVALDRFLELVSRDRKYRNDGARKSMLAVFDLLGDDHPLTREYRRKLTTALY